MSETATAKRTAGRLHVQGCHLYGEPDQRSKHANGRALIGGVVDEHRDWRNTPSESTEEREAFSAESNANAAHLAACWNAVEAVGGDPATVAELVEALRLCADAVYYRSIGPVAEDATERARGALDKLDQVQP